MVHKKTRKYRHTRKQRRLQKRGGNADETACEYVSSRGLLKSCFIHNPQPKSSVTSLDGYDFSKAIKGSTAYVTSSALPAFVPVLDTIPEKIVLVSGDSDDSVPDSVFSEEQFQNFIGSDKIIHWFSQNCVGTHAKLSKIPIGLDYHTLSDKDYEEWGSRATPLEQERRLKEIAKEARAFYERTQKCYSNFHFKMYGDRAEAKEKIPEECMFYEPTSVKRYESWKNQTKYAFVISPKGIGLDCHRTWEALCLGCIPIVKTSPIDSLFEGLPVLIVKDWSDVTPKLLENTVKDFKKKEKSGAFHYKKLTLKYWVNKINHYSK